MASPTQSYFYFTQHSKCFHNTIKGRIISFCLFFLLFCSYEIGKANENYEFKHYFCLPEKIQIQIASQDGDELKSLSETLDGHGFNELLGENIGPKDGEFFEIIHSQESSEANASLTVLGRYKSVPPRNINTFPTQKEILSPDFRSANIMTPKFLKLQEFSDDDLSNFNKVSTSDILNSKTYNKYFEEGKFFSPDGERFHQSMTAFFPKNAHQNEIRVLLTLDRTINHKTFRQWWKNRDDLTFGSETQYWLNCKKSDTEDFEQLTQRVAMYGASQPMRGDAIHRESLEDQPKNNSLEQPVPEPVYQESLGNLFLNFQNTLKLATSRTTVFIDLTDYSLILSVGRLATLIPFIYFIGKRPLALQSIAAPTFLSEMILKGFLPKNTRKILIPPCDENQISNKKVFQLNDLSTSQALRELKNSKPLEHCLKKVNAVIKGSLFTDPKGV